jgi:N-acetyl-alpha-D-glucosaminyl L-malate synthase BshA
LMAKNILATQGIHIPVITTLHGTDITLVGKDPTFEPVVSYSINFSDGVSAVSESLRQDTYKHFKTQAEIKVIPNFIDFERFSKQPKEHFRKAITSFGESLLVHTSNFRKVKRVEDVIRIFDIVQKTLPSKLLLIGDGPERNYIEQLCRELDICTKVTFLGKQDAVEEILSICDLFLMPSESESFGLAALEAMACEVPVISTNTGGIPELNIDGVTGFLSNVGDVDSMASKAIYLLSDKERLQQFKRNALAQAKKFDINVIAPRYEELYEEVLSSSRIKV